PSFLRYEARSAKLRRTCSLTAGCSSKAAAQSASGRRPDLAHNVSLLPVCIHGAQLGLEDLAVVVLRQAVDEYIILGPLEARDRTQAQRVELGAFGVPDHIGDDDLAPFRMRPADHRDLAHFVMREQHFLDLARINV